jgi:transposase
MSSSTKVSLQIDHCTTTADAPLVVTLSRAAVPVCVCGWATVAIHVCLQRPCRECGKLYTVRAGEKHHLCRACNNERRHPSFASAAAASPSTPSPPPPLFDRDEHSHGHLSQEQRFAIRILHKEGRDEAYIAARIPCDVRSVRHWLAQEDTNDSPRSGRKRKTTTEQDAAVVAEAKETKFTTPRRIRRKLGMDVSSRTIDRRLIEVGLFGRVAQHKKELSEEQKRARLSFAEGYKNWTAKQWMNVIFADEKLFWGEGFYGEVFVRRPPGEALKPEHTVDSDPHPEKVSVWGCFCGKGLGYCYIFNENMDGKLLQEVLGTHLVESAELHYDVQHAESWWLLQDNDPKHKSRLVRTWLFNHGIQCLTFPPYSPDLNPIEHLWADLARRVEQYQCETMEELQDIVAEEWKKTSKQGLRKLARSMPHRIQAVIDAKGDHTNY